LWGGSLAGLAASAVLAALLLLAFQSVTAGKARETFEGVTMLFAVVVLFFTSFWLISRVEGRRWAAFLKLQMQAALSAERRFGIASLAFLVVFREGAETVLLYASLFSAASGATMSILAGIVAATVLLVVLFVVSIRGGAVIPVRPFFAITGSLLYAFAFKLAGDGVSELQNVELVGRTVVDWIPDTPALQSWLGIYPTLQTVALQGVLLLAVIAGLGWTMLKRPEEPAAQSGAAVR
jgi:high-affinity iron transporter